MGKIKNTKKLLVFFIAIAALIFSVVTVAGCTHGDDNSHAAKTSKITETESSQGLIVNLDEETNMYRFAYKKSVLNISKEKFDEFSLTNEKILMFCDKMEEIYVLFSDFFMVYNLPEVFTYNSVTYEYKESVGVDANAWSNGENNATYYIEGWLEVYLKHIDIGLPSIVVHEVGHLYTFWSNGGDVVYNGSKYVWDTEVFAIIAAEYILSLPDFYLINAAGKDYMPITETQKTLIHEDWYDEWVKNYQGFIYYKMSSISENYGYDVLHEVLAEMIKKDVGVSRKEDMNGYDIIEMFDLFFDVYAEKTGENVKEKYFTQEELYTVYKNMEPDWEPPLQ